jgi:Zn-dependent protease
MSFQPMLILDLVVLVLALSFHEMSHAWAANRLGDPTAARLGRLTMNPIVHIDPLGTIVLPLLLALTHAGFLFGWAKPTPVNPNNFRHPRRDDALVAAAGPLSNLLLAVAGAALFRGILALGPQEGSLLADALSLAQAIVGLNVLLALFNLLPVPPLDGGALAVNLLPRSMEPLSDILRQYGFLLFLLLVYSGFTGVVLQPISSFITRVLIGPSGL